MKKFFTPICIFIFSFALVGCATTHDRGSGVVLSAKKIEKRDFKAREGTQIGAIVLGAPAAVGGAVVGGFTGLIWSSLAGLGGGSVPAVAAITFGGAVVGAVVIGGIGAAMGAGIGYAYDTSKPLYQFTVKPDNNENPIIVTQYSYNIPVDSHVRILEKDNNLLIKRR